MIRIKFVAGFSYNTDAAEGRYALLQHPDENSWRFINAAIGKDGPVVQTIETPGGSGHGFWEAIRDIEGRGFGEVFVDRALMHKVNYLAERRPGRLEPDVSRWDDTLVLPCEMQLVY